MTHALNPATARGKASWTAAFVLTALLLFAASASAARDPIASGATDLHLKKGFQRKLSNAGIALTGVQGGTVTGTKIGLAVGAGMFDPTTAQGHIEPSGGFKLSRGNRGAPIYGLSVNTVQGAVYAKIAQAHLKIGTFANPVPAREGFGSRFKAGQLMLTENAARLISNRLGLQGSQRLEGGRTLSNLFAIAQPETVTVIPQGSSATLTGNPVTLAKFAAKGVKLPEGIAPIVPATKTTATSFQFPLGGGTLAPDGSSGILATAGGIEITKQTKTLSPVLKLKNIEVDLGAKAGSAELEILPSPPFAGAVARTVIAEVVLPTGAVVANPTTRQISIKGAEVKLGASAASTFNSVFNQPAPEPPPSSNFVVGDQLGALSLLAQGQ